MNPETSAPFSIRAAELRDVNAIVQLIRELAEFEHLTHLLQVTPEKLRPHLFGERPVVEALVAEGAGSVLGFALFFLTALFGRLWCGASAGSPATRCNVFAAERWTRRVPR